MAQKTPNKITVLLSDDEFDRFDRYCRERGFKKSTLIARLIRQYLELEGYSPYREASGSRTTRSPGVR